MYSLLLMNLFPLKLNNSSAPLRIPLFSSSIKAGFPSPAADYIEKTLDFNEYLVKRPAATFCFRVSGDSMINAGIYNDDILVVDRSLQARNNDIVIAVLDNELTVKRLVTSGSRPLLLPENDKYEPIQISDLSSFEVWGVVTFVIHKAV